MAIEFPCPRCRQVWRTSNDKAGLSARCPECGALIVVPAAGHVASFAAAPPGVGHMGDTGEAPETAGASDARRFGFLFSATLLSVPITLLALVVVGTPMVLLANTLYEFRLIGHSTFELVVLSPLLLVLPLLAAQAIGVIKLHLNVASGARASFVDLFYGLGNEGRPLIPGFMLLSGMVLLSAVTVVGPLLLWPVLHLYVDQRRSVGDTLRYIFTRDPRAVGLAMLAGLFFEAMLIAVIGGAIAAINDELIEACIAGAVLFPFAQPLLQWLLAATYLRWSGQRTASA